MFRPAELGRMPVNGKTHSCEVTPRLLFPSWSPRLVAVASGVADIASELAKYFESRVRYLYSCRSVRAALRQPE